MGVAIRRCSSYRDAKRSDSAGRKFGFVESSIFLKICWPTGHFWESAAGPPFLLKCLISSPSRSKYRVILLQSDGVRRNAQFDRGNLNRGNFDQVRGDGDVKQQRTYEDEGKTYLEEGNHATR